MNNTDFFNYYINPLKHLRYSEDWSVSSIFPGEADTTTEGKQKALNALYRFLITNLAEFCSDKKPLEDLSALNQAPLDTLETSSGYAETWIGLTIYGTDHFIKNQATELGIPEDDEVPVSPHFRSNLEALFQKHGVGFEKENVYPPLKN